MTSFYNGVPHSTSVSEISSAPPSPMSCGTTAPSASSPRFGVVVPNRVFVGGIASNTTETELQEVFSPFGKIQEIKIISDRGGVCKGYGFVTFETEEEAKKVKDQPDLIVLKERKLNIAPAVMKQQPFARPYDIAPPAGALLYHNGTTCTYQNGMAFFTAQSAQSPYAARETPLYAAPFGPTQTAPTQQYPQIMYAPYPTQQLPPYLAAGQQYQYTMPFDYFKAVGPTSQYIYAPHSALNGALNNGLGNSSPSPSPGYGSSPAPSQLGCEIYYNGVNHHAPPALAQHQPLYPVETSPAQSEDWNSEQRQAHTPVVSLLKLREEGSLEELEITRTPKKSFPSNPGGPRPRSRRPGRPSPSPSQGSGRGRGTGSQGSLAGQRSASSPHLPSAPNSCLHRSTSLSPSNQVTPAYSSSRQNQHQHHQQPQQGYNPRRGGGPSGIRNSGPKSYMGNARGGNPHYNTSGSHNVASNQGLGFQSNGQNTTLKTSNAPKNPGESVNGLKAASSSDASAPTPSVNHISVAKKHETMMGDDGGAGDASTVRHALPLSPPNTPLPQDSSAGGTIVSGGSDGEVCQKMKALAL